MVYNSHYSPYLRLNTHPPPPKLASRRRQNTRTRSQHNPTIHPNRIEPAPIQNRTANGRPYQESHRNTRKALAQSRTNLIPPIGTQMHDDGRRQRDECSAEEAIECHEEDDGGGGARGYEAETK